MCPLPPPSPAPMMCSMHLKNNHSAFHPDPIWNAGCETDQPVRQLKHPTAFLLSGRISWVIICPGWFCTAGVSWIRLSFVSTSNHLLRTAWSNWLAHTHNTETHIFHIFLVTALHRHPTSYCNAERGDSHAAILPVFCIARKSYPINHFSTSDLQTRN